MVGLSLFPPPVVFVAGENAIKKRREDVEKYTDDCSRGGQFSLCVVVVVVVVVVVAAKACYLTFGMKI